MVILAVAKMLNFLCPDMGQFDATKGKQALEIRSSLSEKRALTDPIMPSDSVDHAHSRQWAKAHGESNTQTLFAYHLLWKQWKAPICLLWLSTARSFKC